MDIAERLAPGRVWSALSLVGYPSEIARAVAYVFSDNLICSDSEAAKKVTFSKEVGVRSVTLEGDVYDPSGTLSGGSKPSGSGILVQVQDLLAVSHELGQAKAKLHQLQNEEAASQQKRGQWKALSTQLEMKEHELKLMRQQVEGSNASRVTLLSSVLSNSRLIFCLDWCSS
jgi:structural maintenance of chromosome 2